MKKNLILLSEFIKSFDEKDFYVFTIYDDRIMLQGDYNIRVARKARSLGFKRREKGLPYVDLVKDNIDITLTK